MRELVLATGNAGKIRELAALLDGLGLRVRSQAEWAVPEAEETGLSFVENAILKARHAARLTGRPALADDSGLEVDALNGAPGIYSARFARMSHARMVRPQEAALAPDVDAANNACLLEALRDVPEAARGARFCCVLALVRHAEDATPLIAEGYWEGRILHAPQGQNGFGYDPLFFVPERGCSSAELHKDEKSEVSHRGKALRALVQRLPSVLLHWPRTTEHE